jgi:hypothetical protein
MSLNPASERPSFLMAGNARLITVHDGSALRSLR